MMAFTSLPVVKNVEMSSLITLPAEMPNRSPRIVCTSRIWNLSEHVGYTQRLGSGYGHF